MPQRKEKNASKKAAIVKHSRQLAEIPLQSFTARDVTLFYGVLYKCQGLGTNRVTISFDELRQLLDYTETSNKRMIDDLREMSFKFSKIGPLDDQSDDFNFKIVVPFIDFEVNSRNGTFTVGVHPDFASALNDLNGTPGKWYTLSDVVGIAQMKSVYAKNCLRMLYMYRNTGVWYTTTKSFRYALSIPKSYKTNDVKKRVIDVINKEFNESDLFESFEIIERKGEKKKKGRPGIEGYTFIFRFNPESEISKYDDISGGKAVPCPLCGKPLTLIAKKDGSGYFYGHQDGWKSDAPCRYTCAAKDLKFDTEVKEAEARDEEEVSVTVSELRSYYEFIRSEEERALGERIESIKENEPEIWDLFEEKESMMAEFINSLTPLPPLSESGKEEHQRRKREAMMRRDDAQRALEDALEARGYDRNFMERRYRCTECQDTGSLRDGTFCSCRKERAEEAKEWLKKK